MPASTPLRLPAGVYNTYRQYKADSQAIIKWVVTTAATLTSPVEGGASCSTSDTTSSKKSKSKGSKGKRQTSSVPDDRYAPAISLNRFLQLARSVASSGTTVPKTILTLLAGTIKLRKRTAAFYSSDVDAWKSNNSHRKAIEILIEAFQVLAGNELDERVATLSLEDGGSGVGFREEAADDLVLPEASTAGKLDNEWIRDNPLINPPGKKKSAGAKIYQLSEYRFIEDDDGNAARKASREAEVLFAVLCFFQDVGRLREHCNNIWKSVKPAGDISRVTAAFVTSEAVNVVKQLEYEIKMDFPELHSLEQIYGVIGKGIVGENEAFRLSIQIYFMSGVYYSIASFSTVLQPGHCPVAKEGFFGYYDPHADRTKMTTEEQLDEDRCVVFNYLPDLVAICMLLPKNPFYPFVRPPHYFPGDDGLFQEFKNYYDGRNHPVSMALVFSVQMLLDTLYIRRAAGIDDLAHMRSFARKIRKEREHFVSTNDMPMPDNMVGFIPGLKGHIEFIDSQLGTDMLYQFKVAKGWGEISRSAIQKDTLWKMNPWLCANALSYAVVDWWSCGADLCSGAGFIQCTMQLWNMLKQTGHLDQTKSDQLMEHLIRLCGHQVFHGAPPKNKFIVRFMLMMGQKPEAFAGNRRKHRDGHNPNDQRGGDRSLRHASGKGVTPDMSEILRLHTSKNGLQKEQITRLHRNSTSPSSYQIVSTEKSAAWDDLLQPLHFTRSLVEAEFPLVTVNFYKIQLLCTAFLRQLWDTLQTDLIRLHQSSADELVENETQLPYVVGWIMQMEGNVLLLAKAAAVMKSMLASETIRDYLLDIDV